MTSTYAARPRARAALRRGGERVAKLDQQSASHWVILRAIRVAIPKRFDSRNAGELEASFELRIRDPNGRAPAVLELRVANGRCEVRPGPARAPGAAATLGANDLILLASGSVGWPELLSGGRLELSGDPFLALRFPGLFRLPARRS